ncbi:unnamed protein product (mitochondrion) [Plasmodiophora brassicae]|uniref:CNH domain-containing protein n=1 Tax=Plasmodiophora brassicae TaxID=37360 RepID=A0A0G4IHV5_PLABS|nr:hypothetical protein PBRA_003578 [Plasmodiophora brassicae]SPQ98726.1 unnamed protein product [Plasmodiophora brassicae]
MLAVRRAQLPDTPDVTSVYVDDGNRTLLVGTARGDLVDVATSRRVHVSAAPIAQVFVVRAPVAIVVDASNAVHAVDTETMTVSRDDAVPIGSGNRVYAIACHADRLAVICGGPSRIRCHVLSLSPTARSSWTLTHEASLRGIAESDLPSIASSMTMHDDDIFIGAPAQYVRLGLRPDGNIDVVPFSSIPVQGVVPICELVPSHRQVLVSTSSRIGLFVTCDGMPCPERMPLAWTHAPDAVRFCADLAVAIIASAMRIEVFTVAKSQLVQCIDLSAADTPSETSALAVSLQRHPSIAAVAAGTHGAVLEQMSLEEEISSYVDALRVDAAVKALGSDPGKPALNALNLRLASAMFHHLLFADALARLDNPRDVLALYPRIASPYAPSSSPFSSLTDLVQAGKERLRSRIDTLDFPRQRLLDLCALPTETLVQRALATLGSRLWAFRDRGPSSEVRSSEFPKRPPRDIKATHEDALLIDTTLLKIAVILPTGLLPYSLEELLLPHNSCLESHVLTFLSEKQAWDALGLFHQSKGEHRRALAVWAESRTEAALQSSVALMSTLGPTHPLILEFAPWCLETNASNAIRVLSGAHGRWTSVLTFLRNLNDPGLPLLYLRFLVREERCMDPAAHTALAQALIAALPSTKEELYQFLGSSDCLYNGAVILQHLRSDQYAERIVVLRRLGAHDRALRTLFDELHDVDGAIQYAEANNAILHMASIALPSADRDLRLRILLLLSRHARKLDPMAVLNVLPEDLQVTDVGGLLNRIIPAMLTRRRFAQVERNLHRIQRVNIERELLEAQRHQVRIDASTVCRVCHKHIGVQPFTVSGSRIFHYQCR